MADLKLEIQQQVQSGFRLLGTVRRLCTYNKISGTQYNTNTGVITYTQTTYQLYMSFFEFSFTSKMGPIMLEENTPVQRGDMIAAFPSLDLAVIPEINDTITDNLGVIWRVIAKSIDPADAFWQLHIRPNTAPA